MKTRHKIIYDDAGNITAKNAVDLVVTSPPYPMIKIWDKIFCRQNPDIKDALDSNNSSLAFELMHKELDKVWLIIHKALKKGGIACINIGDAARTVGGSFKLYSNHSRILNYCSKIGFDILPEILWRKQTNAPNKFMGSGMYPAKAYVTLEHEYILILRKGNNREFNSRHEKTKRRESAFFWEERNNWFSDVWTDLKGTKQELAGKDLRTRSAAFPFELAYRLINMYSIQEDIILDPFLGTGTTAAASIAAGRNSIGYEIDPNFLKVLEARMENAVNYSNKQINSRLARHMKFVEDRLKAKKGFKYKNRFYNFPVMTRQEDSLLINRPVRISKFDDSSYEVEYDSDPVSLKNKLPDKS